MSECEMPQYYAWTEPIARKEHKCCECDAPILKGEKHLCVNVCWEYRPERYRQHILCAEACMLVRDSGMNDDECLYFGGLSEFWSDSRSERWQGRQLEARKNLWRMMLGIRRRENKSLEKLK